MSRAAAGKAVNEGQMQSIVRQSKHYTESARLKLSASEIARQKHPIPPEIRIGPGESEDENELFQDQRKEQEITASVCLIVVPNE